MNCPGISDDGKKIPKLDSMKPQGFPFDQYYENPISLSWSSGLRIAIIDGRIRRT